ncbi:MAG: biotin--[acetyl-CoA-carboxylase] ligase [Ectothiorhodospiraceae bacterium AqS1]|nr:biotin--[acetyl-CoA-carboxylase] ligase [Ectothiorhodospiraceae bacterium AqS1]
MDDRSGERRALMRLLAAGDKRTIDSLARDLGQSPARIEAGIRSLASQGFEIERSLQGLIRHPFAFEPLDRRRIQDALGENARRYLKDIEVHFEIDSTNRRSMDIARSGETLPLACLAEMQSAGRGRNGRDFFSPLGGNLYLSLVATTTLEGASLSGLSPAIAVAVAGTVACAGGAGAEVKIKWPNDIHAQGRKIGGILIESSRGSKGRFVIIGVGINLRLSPAVAEKIDQPVGDLFSLLGGTPPRNAFAARLIDALVEALQRYERAGFEYFKDAFGELDLLAGKDIEVEGAGSRLRGRASGIGENGALLVRVEEGKEPVAIVCGEVRAIDAEAAKQPRGIRIRMAPSASPSQERPR